MGAEKWFKETEIHPWASRKDFRRKNCSKLTLQANFFLWEQLNASNGKKSPSQRLMKSFQGTALVEEWFKWIEIRPWAPCLAFSAIFFSGLGPSKARRSLKKPPKPGPESFARSFFYSLYVFILFVAFSIIYRTSGFACFIHTYLNANFLMLDEFR